MDVLSIILAVVAAVILKMAYTKVEGPTQQEAPELEDVPAQQIDEVNLSSLLKTYPRTQTGDFVE